MTKNIYELMDICRELTKSIRHSEGSLFDHLFGCWKLAMRKGYSDDICVALLLHSIYGTASFKIDSLESRETIKQYVGEHIENLIFQFCNLPNRAEMLLEYSWPDEELRYKLAQMDYINILEQKNRFPVEMQDEIKNVIELYERFLNERKVN